MDNSLWRLTRTRIMPVLVPTLLLLALSYFAATSSSQDGGGVPDLEVFAGMTQCERAVAKTLLASPLHPVLRTDDLRRLRSLCLRIERQKDPTRYLNEMQSDALAYRTLEHPK